MQKISSKILIISTLLAVLLSSSLAVDIGIAWEFNEDDNAEGWVASSSVTDLIISDGTLKTTVTDISPRIIGPPFTLIAEKYGFFHIRLRAPGVEFMQIIWKPSTTLFGGIGIELIGDSLFHEYEIPVYHINSWQGDILGITSLNFEADAGGQIEIDFIRIVKMGAKAEIKSFKPLRTVLKKGMIIPLDAIIKNTGDENGSLAVDFMFPDEFNLIAGNTNIELGILGIGESDTLNWKVVGSDTGNFVFNLTCFVPGKDTVEFNLNVTIVEQYWHQEDFFLSAWSPPILNDSAYNYYSNGNFKFVLSLPANESALSLVELHQMQCFLHAGQLIGENLYLRAPDNQPPPELSQDNLSNLDDMIESNIGRGSVKGYYITDEPNANAFPNLAKVVSYLRDRDPTRLSFINLFPTYANNDQLGTTSYDDHVEQFIDIVKPELISYDHYHFFEDHDGPSYFTNLGIIRKWALLYDLPFCNIIQAVGADFLNWRIPTEKEHRWLVYTSLAYGVRGIVWFHWDHEWGLTGSPKRDELYASIQQLNSEISALGPVLLTLKSVKVYHSDSGLPENGLIKSISDNVQILIGLFKDENSADYFMLMNKDYHDSASINVTLNGTTDQLECFDVDSSKWESVEYQNIHNSSEFICALLPGGGKLYKIGTLTSFGTYNPRYFPNRHRLHQNYPNPFNPTTTIKYEIADKVPMKLRIYDVLGREVSVLVDKVQDAGEHEIIWDAENFASGIYIFSLEANTFYESRKMLFLK